MARIIATRSWRLAFPAPLEARFEADVANERCRKVIRHNYVGISIYNAFLLGDWFLVHDIFAVSVVLHLLVMTPIMGLVIAIVSRRPPVWLREGLLAGGIVLGTMAILGLTLYSRSPLRSSEHLSVVLVILFATMVQRIRFRYVAVAALVSLALYVAALAAFVHHDPARMGVADAVFAGVVLFSLIGCYNLEYELRMSYLFGLRDRLRNEELDAISRRDALTGVGNRRALELAMKRHTGATAEATPSTALLLIDIDLFKTFNDDNGHLTGDICLSRVAGIIADDTRLGADRVFRFGGEEFLVLLEHSTLAEAVAIGDRIRLAVESAAISRGPTQPGVITVSVGAAAGLARERQGMVDLVADADRALYAAKHAGRNQVQAAGTDAAPSQTRTAALQPVMRAA